MFPTPKTISGLLKAAGTFDGGEKIAKYPSPDFTKME